MNLFVWLFNIMEVAFRFFVGPKQNASPNYVDRACQTDAEKNWQKLEGEHEFSFKNMAKKRLFGETSPEQETQGVSPYVWDYAYWPSEGGI